MKILHYSHCPPINTINVSYYFLVCQIAEEKTYILNLPVSSGEKIPVEFEGNSIIFSARQKYIDMRQKGCPKKLKKIIKEKNFSNKKIYSELKISKQFFCHLKNGRKKISFLRRYQFAEILKIDPIELISDECF
jgi:hypothetical protein